MVRRIGILTGGGDCGGLNAVIEGATRAAVNNGIEVDGIFNGWEGAIYDDRRPLRISDVEGIHSTTGTELCTTRTNPYKFTGDLDGVSLVKADVSARVIENANRAGHEAIIVVGGDDTLSVVRRLEESALRGLSVDYKDAPVFVGIPKTMDGDLQTYSLGLDTAINRARRAIEEFRPILAANRSIGFVEIFGRDVGRVTFKAGISAGADVILIPEVSIDLDYLVNFLAVRYDERAKRNNGKSYAIVAVAEGTANPVDGKQVYQERGEDSFGHGKLGGIGNKLAKLVYDKLKNDPRICAHTRKLDIKTKSPTYDVRGGETLYSDSYIGQKLGIAAVQAILNGVKSGMAIVNFNEHNKIETMPIDKLIEPRPVHIKLLDAFEAAGIYCFGRRPLGHYENPVFQVVNRE